MPIIAAYTDCSVMEMQNIRRYGASLDAVSPLSKTPLPWDMPPVVLRGQYGHFGLKTSTERFDLGLAFVIMYFS